MDLKKEATITAEKMHYKVGWTPYEGMRIKGVPVMTILRGIVVAENGDVVGKPGYGQFLTKQKPTRDSAFASPLPTRP
ncbi:unnamed protein product [marine sediment metagenome]|uniref:Amidohydrolase-related domain-containing protein n=1 Tax=marine sediment metagenome TaxID=412755 RepID=X1M7F6_9ZZZZ